MDARRAVLVVVAGIISASCSEKSAPNREERQPDADKIAEDCVNFVRLTKILPAQSATADCPQCPPAGADVLAFRQVKTDQISCSGDTCTVLVTIRVSFNPGAGERIAGGLTAWISPEQRSAYLNGKTPPGEQAYRVKVTYKRHGEAWRAIEFDRATGE